MTNDGHLAVGGVDLDTLADEFGTPLYVYDEATIRGRARAYRDALAQAYPGESLVCYAAKAYCAPWLLRMVVEERLGLDVVSGGELTVAQAARVPRNTTYFHGNNKTPDELELALSLGIGRIVVDNFEEIDRLSRLASARGVQQEVLLRVAPGVEAHTHEHIKTGAQDTKFGLSLETGSAEQAARAIKTAAGLTLVGLHAHIGSQVFELEPYGETIDRVVGLAARLRDTSDFTLRELSPGGGFGIRYTEQDDQPLAPGVVSAAIAESVIRALSRHGFGDALPRLTIEPGRSIVGPAGVALYRVGSIKEIAGIRTYVATDGGMADNIRPTAYGARYLPVLANRMRAERDAVVAIAGKYCESGDILMKDARMPMPRVGDLVAVPTAGAYHLSMASNYNLSLRPAVVVVSDGAGRLVRRRETFEDVLRTEVAPPS